MSSIDHTRKLCAVIMYLVFGVTYATNPTSCMQFGRTKLFLKLGQVGASVVWLSANCLE